ncbi:uncharacterized protein LOC116193968 [Punica granatum]|uniref:Uncharacterized protein n=2 Tax=Punica granatum TaxID=22663 RepID=A0A218X1S3_PUNGR|nr:uncharacterized protein LOC116193968 [Punica granatum]OWM79145.1 hypothetical protein CDL15_Pgr003316 [Punica granatum]PKI49270.1 hypothetical protein CRG98_030343 [Punica granatum]
MGGKVRRQNKFKHVILAPFRIMCKAKNFYMKGMEDFAGRVSQGGGVSGPGAAQVPTVPRSFSKRNEDDDEDYRELLRSVSKRNAERQQAMGVTGPPSGVTGMGGMRSYSVGIGKIGRIDEETPCKFEEVPPRAESLYPRSRSQAVGRRNAMFY